MDEQHIRALLSRTKRGGRPAFSVDSERLARLKDRSLVHGRPDRRAPRLAELRALVAEGKRRAGRGPSTS
jgi:hypothetical protein